MSASGKKREICCFNLQPKLSFLMENVKYTLLVRKLLRGIYNLDEVLELLDKTTKRTQKIFEESKETAQRQTSAYEQIMQMKDATEEQRLKGFHGQNDSVRPSGPFVVAAQFAVHACRFSPSKLKCLRFPLTKSMSNLRSQVFWQRVTKLRTYASTSTPSKSLSKPNTNRSKISRRKAKTCPTSSKQSLFTLFFFEVYFFT